MERIKAGATVLPKDIRVAAAEAKYQQQENARNEKTLPRGKSARAAEIEARAARERDREARQQRAMNKHAALVQMIAHALGNKRCEALALIRQLDGRGIGCDELLEALASVEGGA